MNFCQRFGAQVCFSVCVAVSVPAAGAIQIPESWVQSHVEKKFPRRSGLVEVESPKVHLNDGTIRFCALAKVRLVMQTADFCMDVVPEWRQQSHSLHASQLSLVSVDVPGRSQASTDPVKKWVNEAILPSLQGIELYRSETLTGRFVKSVEIRPGVLGLHLGMPPSE